MTTIYTTRGSNILVTSSLDSVSSDALTAGYYTVAFNDDLGFFLKVNEALEVPARLYGDVDAVGERFINTFVARSKRKLGTGVLLVGVKGSGKSLTAKLTCVKAVEMGYPVIQIETGLPTRSGKREIRVRVDFAMESAMNRDRSTLVVEKEGYKFTLTRQKERSFQYEHLL